MRARVTTYHKDVLELQTMECKQMECNSDARIIFTIFTFVPILQCQCAGNPL